MQNKASNFKHHVSYETVNLFVWLFFAPASLYLSRLTHPDFWQQPAAVWRWVALVGVAYGAVYAGIFLFAHAAPFWWGSEAKQTYGVAMMTVSYQWLVTWLTQPFQTLAQRLSRWIRYLDTQIHHHFQQCRQRWQTTHAHCCQSARPFALFGQAPLRIP